MTTRTHPTVDPHEHTTRCWWNPDNARWVCSPGTTAGQDEPLVDVRDMIVVHTAMLRAFRLAPAAVRRVEPGAARQAGAVDRHLGFLGDLLHHHHQGEDDLLWPRLRTRLPRPAGTLIDEVESQHTAIDAALQAVTAARHRWSQGLDIDTRDGLVAALEHLHGLLKAHLDLEEGSVLPLAASVLTDAEWHAIGDAAAAAMPKPALTLAFGMFAYEADPAVLRTRLTSAPALPRVLIPRIAPWIYAHRARQVHGTSRP